MSLKERYKNLFADRRFILSVLIGILVLVMGVILTSFSQTYANSVASNPVGDLVLDNLPVFPWPNLLFWTLVWGVVLFGFSLSAIVFYHPKYIPATLKTIALLYWVRAAFFILTHLGSYPEKLSIDIAHPFLASMAEIIYGSEDLFFSGHTSLPFISALVFWKIKPIRYYLLCAAVFFGMAVLWSRAHYSIDVFAAPFIAYSLFIFSKHIFKRDFDYLN